jgi:ABC-type transport system involved in multi-copper enzyme maturation permease subunit
MISMLASERYGDLKVWIGIGIAFGAFVTIMALVATFTLWGMISTISDNNAHVLLRSSIGNTPYLFTLWMLLAFLGNLISGPSRVVVAAVVFFLFFDVVVPLSAFGRLIIHTGAMAERRVLEQEFERHSCLLACTLRCCFGRLGKAESMRMS